MNEQELPNLLKLKWKDCEKEPPTKDDYYVVKYGQKRHEWFLSYYLTKDKKFLSFSVENRWKYRINQPWRWAPLPRIEKEHTLFDLELDQ